jgi:hypothetical protein
MPAGSTFRREALITSLVVVEGILSSVDLRDINTTGEVHGSRSYLDREIH